MPDGSENIEIKILERISDVPSEEWDTCAGIHNPFVSHAFLNSLEESGSVRPKTGWLPQHLVLQDRAGRLLGAVPLYLKSHSMGEYVFDHSWAHAYERVGGSYYPKLQSCVPFTPVPGPRLLVRPDADRDSIAAALMTGLREVTRAHKVSSLHVTFPQEEEWQSLGEAGFLQRQGLQYHWHNQGYGDFDDFLSALSSRKRKAIRKERREAAASGLTIRALSGGDISAYHWDAFYEFYLATVDKKWAYAYLTRSFFRLLAERLGDRVVLIVAEDKGRPVAGALNLQGADALYGRNWGCAGHYRFLHFELCYYQAIDYAIAQGLQRVEAGAQGQHKIQRGYLPVPTYSAHWIPDAGFRQAVARFLDQERAMVDEEIEALAAGGPFRKEAIS